MHCFRSRLDLDLHEAFPRTSKSTNTCCCLHVLQIHHRRLVHYFYFFFSIRNLTEFAADDTVRSLHNLQLAGKFFYIHGFLQITFLISLSIYGSIEGHRRSDTRLKTIHFFLDPNRKNGVCLFLSKERKLTEPTNSLAKTYANTINRPKPTEIINKTSASFLKYVYTILLLLP